MRQPLLALLRTYRWAVPTIVVLGTCAALAEGVGLSLFIPLLSSADVADTGGNTWWAQRLFDLFEGVPPDRRVAAIAVCILTAITLRATLTYANAALFAWLDARISHRLRSQLFDQLLSVGYGFFERAGIGGLLNTLGSETWRTSDALSLSVDLITSACTVLVYVVLLLVLSPTMAAAVGVALLLLSLIVRMMTARVQARGREATRANASLSERMLEGVSGMAVIRAFNREAYEQQRFDAASERVSDVNLRLTISLGAVAPVYEVLSAGLLVAVVLVSLRTPGNVPLLLVFVFVLYRLQPRVKQLESARTDLRALRGAVEDVTGLLDRSDKPYLSTGSERAGPLRSALRFSDVTFRYGEDGTPALEGVSFQIPAQCTTALVGPSGAGKSTVINLLLRLYDPADGQIRADGVPLPQLNLVSWRQRIALVSQDLYLFNASVRDNIAYGRPDASDADVRAAAHLANADEFITRLVDGYETPIGDRGVLLSGGQRQRLALARAIIRDPDILILDEATNALDARSEHLIRDALDSFARERTIIIVAHRFSTIERADHVVVLDRGHVREEGDRESLLRRGGLFRELHTLEHQTSGTASVSP
ncbi:ABC transporter ATP-binding protein [soil metagenome]